ncbi:hypothetical protein [Bacillus thuringiensis]|uniref:hypothetical protein n=1 Tax=Bacillus thuringiensis TaxID=1428 RepID=UPI000BED92E2|nr:hypothetical protein [Bacillus thuringiensis]PDZ57810.1 hypothetical protein CON29_28140 [Bacillus thuringiensis]
MKLDNMQEILSVAQEMGEGVYKLFSESLDYIPHLGRFIQTVKFNRLERRMNENSVQLQRIGKLLKSSTLSDEYITQRIFPIVLADLIEEHEDAKFNLILNGFENVFIDEKEEESIVINYFDTLRNLRYKDIKRLLYLAEEMDSYVLPKPNSEEESFAWSIDNKLAIYGLIKTDYILDASKPIRTSPVRRDEFFVTPYGNRFLKFIRTIREEVAGA